MFNIGSGELLVLLLLGLLVLGPERLPKAVGQVGRYVAQMRKLSSGFQDEIKRAMDPHDAPFRPGEETIRPGNVTDEVRVVGVDPADEDEDQDQDDGDRPPIRLPDDAVTVADVPFGPARTEVEEDGPGPDGAVPPVEADDDPGETGTVTPLRGHDDGDARAAG